MSAIYSALPTNAGQAKIANALALGVPLKITHMAVGDGNGQPVTPDPAKTALVHEVRRAPLNTLFQDPLNQAQLVAEQIIPEDVGDWWIREVGLYDEAGTLIAIANCPDTYKPLLTSGAGRTQVIRMVLIVSDTSAVELKIDPSVVLATRKYVDDVIKAELSKLDGKQSVRAATTANIALSATKTVDGVVLAVGDRVLVKDQADAKQNGIYLVSAQAWTRTADADSGAKLSSGARIGVEEGTVNAGRVWYLATTGAITLGTTALAFKDEHPEPTTHAQFSSDKSIATTEFVQRALGSFNGYISVNTSRSLAATDIGKALLVGTTGITLTLPTPSSLGAPLGVAVDLFTNSSTLATIEPGAGVILNHMGAAAVASISLLRGQSLKLIAVTGTAWQVIASTCGLGLNADFAGELTIVGQQKLPSGWIMKRGNISTSTYPCALTFPTAFPTACAALIVTGWSAGLGHSGRGQGGATISLNTGEAAPLGFDWVAFGY